MSETLYIQFKQNTEVKEHGIKLGRVASLWCKDKDLLSRCSALTIKTVEKDKSYRGVFTALDIVKMIQNAYPKLDVTVLGEQDFIVEYNPHKKPSKCWEWFKAAIIFIIIFFGAAFTIMTFNNDVNVGDVFMKVYELVTGEVSNGFTVMEWSYSLGLLIGILVFYNHFSRKKVTSDPTPLEVEMRLYEQDLNTTVIENNSRGNQER